MLSRVADSLYWTSRYMERGENVARAVDVNMQLLLDVPSATARQLSRNCLPLIACLGDESAFLKKHKKTDVNTVVEYLVFDRDNPNSVVGSLCAARENARTVREQITVEMWEQINRTFHWCVSKSARQYFERNQYEFFQRAVKTFQLFQGITDSSMVRNEGWHFIQLGKYLERADKTSRALDEEFHLLGHVKETPDAELAQWGTVLESCHARQAYQIMYSSEIVPKWVAELLLLSEHHPRSVRFCAHRIDESLRYISGVLPGRFSNAAEKKSGRLVSELTFSNIEDLLTGGFHQAMDRLQIQLNEIGAAIFEVYIDQPPLPEPQSWAMEQMPQQ